MSRLLALYPRAWRARYGDEFADLLQARPPSLRDRLDIVVGAIDARVNPQVPGADDRERVVGGDRAARIAAITTGVLFSIWGLIGTFSMVPWDSGLEPRGPAELMTIAWMSGMLGSLLSAVTFAILAVRYQRTLGGAGLAGAVLTPTGLIASAMGLGMFALLALAVGAVLFSWRANGRILSGPVATTFAAAALLLVGSFLAFVAGGGQDVSLLLPMATLGPAWILLGVGLRQPREIPEAPTSPTPSLVGA